MAALSGFALVGNCYVETDSCEDLQDSTLPWYSSQPLGDLDVEPALSRSVQRNQTLIKVESDASSSPSREVQNYLRHQPMNIRKRMGSDDYVHGPEGSPLGSMKRQCTPHRPSSNYGLPWTGDLDVDQNSRTNGDQVFSRANTVSLHPSNDGPVAQNSLVTASKELELADNEPFARLGRRVDWHTLDNHDSEVESCISRHAAYRQPLAAFGGCGDSDVQFMSSRRAPGKQSLGALEGDQVPTPNSSQAQLTKPEHNQMPSYGYGSYGSTGVSNVRQSQQAYRPHLGHQTPVPIPATTRNKPGVCQSIRTSSNSLYAGENTVASHRSNDRPVAQNTAVAVTKEAELAEKEDHIAKLTSAFNLCQKLLRQQGQSAKEEKASRLETEEVFKRLKKEYEKLRQIKDAAVLVFRAGRAKRGQPDDQHAKDPMGGRKWATTGGHMDALEEMLRKGGYL